MQFVRALVSVALPFALLGSSWSASQPVPSVNQGQPNAQSPQEISQPAKNAEVPSPGISELTKPQERDANKDKNERKATGFSQRLEAWWDRFIDDPIAIFTFILAVYTGCLYVATKNCGKPLSRLFSSPEKSSSRPTAHKFLSIRLRAPRTTKELLEPFLPMSTPEHRKRISSRLEPRCSFLMICDPALKWIQGDSTPKC
jgi:hypothetical protein